MRAAWPLATASEMRALDAHTIEHLGVPGEILMESAGRAVADVALAEWRALGRGDAEVLVACGRGHNGGDGFVVARHLHLLDVPVRAALLGGERAASGLRGDAAAAFARMRAVGVRCEGDRWRAPAAGVVVDALFGTGLSRALDGAAAAAVRRIARARAAGCRVVAVDLPSGLDADTGAALGACVEADVTVAIGLPKLGLALEPGRARAGRIFVARIGIADAAPGVGPLAFAPTRAAAGALLPPRPATGHKGSFGHVLVAAGSEGKTGAAALAARAAARAGAGLVTVACPAGLGDVMETLCLEAMTAPLADTARRGLAAAAEDALLALARERDVVALGPGIGREADTGDLVRAFAKRCERPLVLDADALFAFGDELERLRERGAPTVLTPHPGEAARLLGVRAADVNAGRVACARELARRSGAVAVLKGAPTVVAAPDGAIAVNPTGGPALASGGTGDVLTGAIAALVAQGADAFAAAVAAVFAHGLAGDRIGRRIGDAGLLAGDLADALPAALAALREAARDVASDRPVPGPPALLVAFPEPDRDARRRRRPRARVR
ncbi:MAG: NAD(P)H-hydrate dehydratase [Myxococcota bacterium]